MLHNGFDFIDVFTLFVYSHAAISVKFLLSSVKRTFYLEVCKFVGCLVSC